MSKVFMDMEVFTAIVDEKGELEKSNSVLRKQSQGYLEDLRAANDEIKDLEEKLKELDRYKTLAKDLNNQNLNLLKIKSDLEKKLKEKKDVVLENECSRLNMCNNELQQELDATEAENESLYNQLIKKSDEIISITKECERLKKANRELEDETYDLEDSNIEYYNLLCEERDKNSKLKEELQFVRDKNEILMEDNERLAQHLTSAENSLQEKEKVVESVTVQVKNLNDSPLVMMDDSFATEISAFAITNEEAQEHLLKDNSKNNEDVNNIIGLAMNLVKAAEKLTKENENLKKELADTDHHLDEALDSLGSVHFENDELVKENEKLKNIEKALRYQIEGMCGLLEGFRKRMHTDITHDDEEAEGTYYPRTFQEGLTEIEALYEGLMKDIDRLAKHCEWKDEEVSRMNDENYELRLKEYECDKFIQKMKGLLKDSEDLSDSLRKMLGLD